MLVDARYYALHFLGERFMHSHTMVLGIYVEVFVGDERTCKSAVLWGTLFWFGSVYVASYDSLLEGTWKMKDFFIKLCH